MFAFTFSPRSPLRATGLGAGLGLVWDPVAGQVLLTASGALRADWRPDLGEVGLGANGGSPA